ncbi:hypothetical protein HMPREF3155_11885 [Corynebacterium sp. HMSC06D04]|uniref:hypothetical protein n=1 Tax=Corynebacterium TaxID=1716 RepID=UPI0008A52BFB|nr:MULTISPECIES: hypothetical protein [Corynebacterium]MCG7247798.1 hypothetical protein [Corynebacterium simulans]OFT32769.1 hypothetical protein HMPREF3169_09525 [Corynebacterium sp. HMSC08C04]OFT49108.1 hypothetical protein HMPREF3155_11885 [Corynebacterium sp. HMSC06D04]
MKKFSRFATAGLVFAAGLSLAACHPPNQQDSTSEKIDNASTYTGKAPKPAESSSQSEASATQAPEAEATGAEATGAEAAGSEAPAAGDPNVVVETQVVPAQ